MRVCGERRLPFTLLLAACACEYVGGFAQTAWCGADHGILGIESITGRRLSMGHQQFNHVIANCWPPSATTGAVLFSRLRGHRQRVFRARPKRSEGDLTLLGVGSTGVGPGDFEWEGNLDEHPYESPMLPDSPLSDSVLMPFDAPPSASNTITTWSESEGSEAWALVMPDLQDMRTEIEGLDELEREICGQLSKTSATAATAIALSYPPTGEYRVSKSSLRERLSLIRMKKSTLKAKLEDYQPELEGCTLKVLGEGGEARILLGKDLTTGENVAIKVAKRGPHDTLETEFTILNTLRKVKGFPQAIFFSRQKLRGNDVSALVMPAMGTNVLGMWFETTRGKSGLHEATVLDLGAKMLSRLESLHEIGYVHRDIKPNNFLMGGPGGAGPVCLIDMGLAVKWAPLEGSDDGNVEMAMEGASSGAEPEAAKAVTSTPIDWTKIPSTRLDITHGGDDALFFGTRRYCSKRAHHANAPLSYRDDLESLAYTLAFLGCGTLPWHADDSLESIEAEKQRAMEEAGEMAWRGSRGTPGGRGSEPCMLDGMVAPLQQAIAGLLLHSMDLRHDQFPDYKHCKELFQKAYSALHGVALPGDDFNMKWRASVDTAVKRPPPTECIDMMF